MKRFLFKVILAALLLPGPVQVSRAGDVDPRALTEESRKVADQLVGLIRTELTRAMEASGPLRSVIVCKYAVPEATSSVSRKTVWRVTRVSNRVRNPALGMADAWELKVLDSFDRRVERGEKADAMEHVEVVTEGGQSFHRYMRALPMGPLCIACHGPADQISDPVKAQIAAEYPFDRAIGYRLGQVRGAITIKRPLP